MIQSGKVYTDEIFAGLHLEPGEVNECEFLACVFRRCAFQQVIFRTCRFVDCHFKGTDLSLLELPGSSFAGVRFEGSKLSGVNWSRADWSMPGIRDKVGYYRSVLNHSTFLGLDLPGLKVIDCNATGVDFREANLREADFSGTDLLDSLFGNTKLSGADLSRALNYQIHPGQNTLKGTKFSLPEALSLLYNLEIELVSEA